MTERALIYEPRAPHPESLADPHLSISDAAGELLAHFCPRHKVGGVYDLKLHAWSIYTPMTVEEFVSALPRLGVRIGDSYALQQWLDAIRTAAPPSAGAASTSDRH